MISRILYVLLSTPDYSLEQKTTIKNNVSTYINNMTQQSLNPFSLISDSGLSLEIHAFIKYNSKIFAGTYKGIYISSDGGINWMESNRGLDFFEVRSLAYNETSIFAGTNGGGIFRSNDSGNNWQNISKKLLRSCTINSIIATDGFIIAATNNGLIKSIDNGNTWIENNYGLPCHNPESNHYHAKINTLVLFNKNIFAGTLEGIFRSTDNGDVWVETDRDITDLNITSLSTSNGLVYAGTNSGVIFTSNNGDIWNQSGSVGSCINAIVVDENGRIVLGTDAGIYNSLDYGKNWTAFNTSLSTKRVYALLFDAAKLFAGTYFGGVFVSMDSGVSWNEININLAPYLGTITMPVSPGIPNFVDSLPLVPIVNGKPILDLEEMALNEVAVLAYTGTGDFPEMILIQFSGHITGEVVA